MSFKYVQLTIGALVTDEALRLRFLREPRETLARLHERGWELTPFEMEALLSTDPRLWMAVAAQLPSSLQRCPLSNEVEPGPTGQF